MIPTALLLMAAATASPSVHATPQTVVRAMFDAFNRHDAMGMAVLYAEDARLSSSDFCTVRMGRAGVVRTYRALFERLPDIHDEVQDVLIDGDRVAVRFVARSGQGAGSLALPIATFLVVEQGLIRSDDSLFDNAGHPCES
ncbi:nuclear transport factor 2 family protein [Dyella amyloliquefaciens]|uniref:nuclear transport factor 2 family protein n=1 Tax=Dyella amyloliquefaciens TaxID=1770545 RepID=UPI00102E71DA|nr:nuclear transport factor 2 family protein [Dyella amyloliquefaciens]